MKIKLILCSLSLLVVMQSVQAQECDAPNGAYAGFGYAANVRSNAAFPYRGHLYGGYRFCNGIQLEFRHTSGLGTDDGFDTTGDHENDITTSENSIGAYYTVWFK